MKKQIINYLIIMIGIITLCACGKDKGGTDQFAHIEEDNAIVEKSDNNAVPNENYFVWDGNIIVGITEEGNKQQTLIIPKRCEGFGNVSFIDSEIEYVIFEGEQDVELKKVFNFMVSLVDIQLPKELTKIDIMSFEGCSNLQKITIPESVTYIDEYAFARCDSLKTVIFAGNNVESINKSTFKDCTSLKEIILPDSVTLIGKDAFKDCKSLEKIVIPDNVKTIEEYAFYNCTSLADLTLSEGIDVIGSSAFANSALEELHLPANINLTNMNVTAFGMNTYSMKVYIVKNSWCDNNQDIWNPDGMFGEVLYE